MKELSIEEKAKAYDEAIEKLRNFYRDYDTVSRLIDVKEELANLFPELKESKDERIRKDIIYFLSRNTFQFGEDIDKYKSWIAWLEKQGEHANFLSKIQVGDKVTRNEDGELVNLSQLNRVAKPAEEYNITGIKSRNAQGKLGEMIKNLKPVNEVLEQKPTWSEEDEKQARQIERIVHDDGCTQKLQKQIADWLKSLKDRCTLKPSKEQIKALEHFVRSVGESGYASPYDNNTKLLYSLLEQLKKLKG